MSRNLPAVVLSGGDVSPSRGEFKNAVHRNSRQCSWGPAALARYVSAVSVGMGVMASSGADRQALQQAAAVAIEAFEKQSIRD